MSLNQSRRERLKGALTHLQYAETTIERVLDEEKESVDSVPENLQFSDRFTAMEEAVGYLEDAISNIQEAANNVGHAIDER